jgi:hypothetical protein
MADSNSRPTPWQVLALRANVHLGTARILIDLALEGDPPEAFLGPLRSIQIEVTDAQDCVRSIAGVAR